MISGFSQAFARILNEFVNDASFSRQDIAQQAGRSRAFVSDQLLGKRPVDTDVLTAVADLFNISGRFLTQQVLNQMPPDVVGIPGVTPAPDDDLAARRQSAPAAVQKRAARKKPGTPQLQDDQ